MKVPFLDLKAQYASIRSEIEQAVQEVLQSTQYAGGPYVERFENRFAAFCKRRYAVACGSGTSALKLALAGLSVGPGDEVITAPNTFIATAEAVTACGATPVFVDVDEDTYNLKADLLEEAITPRTRAVIPVHLYGQTADMDGVMRIARSHNLLVIEDACQAHGAEYKGLPAGSMGHAGCFSFYPGKNLGACGEAGAVVTDDPKLAESMRVLRDHGQKSKYYHNVIGWNDRMDGIQAAILTVKLEHLPAWNEARRKRAALYGELLSGLESVITPVETEHSKHVYHIYAIRVPDREAMGKELAQNGIQCGIHYPVPIHLQQAYRHLGHGRGDFPCAETCADEVLSLPMFPELTPGQVSAVCKAVRNAAPVAARPR
jgi:dTDP-4-amino-4,6-dideoxygalactose transaminase